MTQLLSHLKLSGLQVGLLINFNVIELRRGIRRLVNNKDYFLRFFSAFSAYSAVNRFWGLKWN